MGIKHGQEEKIMIRITIEKETELTQTKFEFRFPNDKQLKHLLPKGGLLILFRKADWVAKNGICVKSRATLPDMKVSLDQISL